ncbi:hypothetical protein ACA910_007735 [Epithemia clementina (nom. ined.)]
MTTPVQEPQGMSTEREEPDWLIRQRQNSKELWGERLVLPEWQDEQDFRAKNGWQGRDLIHDVDSPVRITEYYVRYGNGQGLPKLSHHHNQQEGAESTVTETTATDGGLCRGGVGTQLTGIVQFTPRAESHRGYCHGGSMCSVLDDVIGWCGFVVTGQFLPWSGFTVQINTSLQKPIAVGTTLLVRARVTDIERRKVSIAAEIVAPAIASRIIDNYDDRIGDREGKEQQEDETIFASGTGLVVLNKGVLPAFATTGSFHKWPSSVAMT